MDTIRKYIMEISANGVEVIAQSLHIYLLANEENSIYIRNALKELVDQTDIVYFDPKAHNVGEAVAAKIESKAMRPILFIPLKIKSEEE